MTNFINKKKLRERVEAPKADTLYTTREILDNKFLLSKDLSDMKPAELYRLLNTETIKSSFIEGKHNEQERVVRGLDLIQFSRNRHAHLL